ncbi:MAG: hypothetical protein GY943_32570, partial [Chloroflexi bacterium]|nr:hypothetical protein [Chloroflexota bacterium]
MPKEKTGTNKKNGFILAMFYIGLLGLSTIWFGAYLSGRENSTEAVVMAPSPLPARPDASAVNEIVPIGTGYQLSNPRHTAVFSSNGIHFMPNDGPTWEWQLDYVGSAKGEAATAVSLTATTPQNNQANIIAYLRGAIIEQYIAHYQNVEQQFILPQPLALNKADLLLTGTVNSTGNFVETTNGWLWITDEGVVSLGDVTVFDANGANIPATLTVTATETQIWVDGTALASADYPVTIDPTIGSSDFRISDAGSDSNALTDAFTPAVAYNSTDNEYLVVWAADNADGIVEIYGQRINAATGVEVGNNDFRISDMGGTDSNAAFSAQRPDVTYNSSNNEYLVVWHGDDDTGSLVDEEFEIYGQRIYGDLSDGDEAGNNDFRISDMGSTDGDEVYDAWNTAVTYNNTNNEYLVVWQGDDTTDNAVEIYAQRIYGNRATGDEVGNNDFRISDMGSTDSSTAFRGERPAVAYNSSSNQYLVVWQGDDDTSPLVDDEYEIFGQRVYGNRATGDEINSDFRISDMGTNGDTDYGASEPAVVYNSSATNEYLIVWSGDDDTSPLVDGELEIFGQRLSAGGVEQGGDFRISDMGDNGDTSFKAFAPSVMYNTDDDSYLVVWRGDDNQDFGGGMLADNEHEIFGEWLDASTG